MRIIAYKIQLYGLKERIRKQRSACEPAIMPICKQAHKQEFKKLLQFLNEIKDIAH